MKPYFVKIRKKFLAWLRESDNFRYNDLGEAIYQDPAENEINKWDLQPKKRNTATARLAGSDRTLSTPGVSFTLYSAAGGIVIETCRYDDVADQTLRSMHVIPDDTELHVALAQIITIEALKNS